MKYKSVLVSELVISGIVIPLFLAGCGGSGGGSGSASTGGGVNPVPTITQISPTSALAGGATGFELTISGTNFIAGSMISFGGTMPSTTFVSTTQLVATIPTADIASAGSPVVTVTNPPPGGGTSNAVNFRVYTASSGFTATGNLTTARAEHTATLLPNGKVLIAGGGNGVDGFQPLGSAELYDPSTGMFTPTGSMTTARTWGHTATLLSNGRVLIAGGSARRDILQPLASAELYDPATGTFTPTGSMTIVQRAGPATLLVDGRVFVAGETNAEIYDPAGGAFAPTGAYVDAIPVWWDTVSLLGDGRVLVTGVTECGSSSCSAGVTELYDPKSGTFSRTGPMKGWVNVNTATLLMDGKVLFVEGNDSAFPDDVEVYDPTAGTFTHTGNTSGIHEFSAAVRLRDGTVLISGGQLPGGDGNSASELYLPASGTFAFGGGMTAGRHEHTATLLNDGRVLIVGGFSLWPTPTASAEIYKP